MLSLAIVPFFRRSMSSPLSHFDQVNARSALAHLEPLFAKSILELVPEKDSIRLQGKAWIDPENKGLCHPLSTLEVEEQSTGDGQNSQLHSETEHKLF